MIEKLMPVGYLGLVLVLVAGGSGYTVAGGSDDLGLHLVLALLGASCLFLVYLCLAIYWWGTAQWVRRSVAAGASTAAGQRYQAQWSRGMVSIVLGGLPLAVLVATGLPTYTGVWAPLAHHLAFYAAVLLQGGALWRLRQEVPALEAELLRVATEGEAGPG